MNPEICGCLLCCFLQLIIFMSITRINRAFFLMVSFNNPLITNGLQKTAHKEGARNVPEGLSHREQHHLPLALAVDQGEAVVAGGGVHAERVLAPGLADKSVVDMPVKRG